MSDLELARLVEISETPLDVAAHEAAAARPGAGATVVFCGVVRDADHGRAVTELEYQGHPSAQAVLEAIVAEIEADAGVLGLAVSHRLGTLQIGDAALVAAVSTAHRHEAFAICGRLVEEVKHRLPIWKRQTFADGTDEWVNCP
jgi:molybdopterin synthase catalytic subunit